MNEDNSGMTFQLPPGKALEAMKERYDYEKNLPPHVEYSYIDEIKTEITAHADKEIQRIYEEFRPIGLFAKQNLPEKTLVKKIGEELGCRICGGKTCVKDNH